MDFQQKNVLIQHLDFFISVLLENKIHFLSKGMEPNFCPKFAFKNHC